MYGDERKGQKGTEGRKRGIQRAIWELRALGDCHSVLVKPGGSSCVLQRQLGPEKEEKALADEAAVCTESASYLFWFWFSLSCYTLHYVAFY